MMQLWLRFMRLFYFASQQGDRELNYTEAWRQRVFYFLCVSLLIIVFSITAVQFVSGLNQTHSHFQVLLLNFLIMTVFIVGIVLMKNGRLIWAVNVTFPGLVLIISVHNSLDMMNAMPSTIISLYSMIICVNIMVNIMMGLVATSRYQFVVVGILSLGVFVIDYIILMPFNPSHHLAMAGSLLMIGVSIILGCVLYWLIRRLQIAINDKDLLIREIHHRVKNTVMIVLSLIDDNRDAIQDPAAQFLINEMRSRIQSYTLVHEYLYHGNEQVRVDLNNYLTELVSRTWSTLQFEGANIQIQTEIALIEVNLDTAVSLGLILNELITNSFKYAFVNQNSGLVQINLCVEDDQVVLTFANNGSPLPEGFDRKKSLGMSILENRIRSLQASLKVENENGVRFIIRFPFDPVYYS